MIKIIEKKTTDSLIIPMSEMKPLQVGVIVDGIHKGFVVMRTASIFQVEIMDLSNPRKDSCFTSPIPNLQVKLLAPGEKIVVELSND